MWMLLLLRSGTLSHLLIIMQWQVTTIMMILPFAVAFWFWEFKHDLYENWIWVQTNTFEKFTALISRSKLQFDLRLNKPACIIIRLLFGFASELTNSTEISTHSETTMLSSWDFNKSMNVGLDNLLICKWSPWQTWAFSWPMRSWCWGKWGTPQAQNLSDESS